MTGSTFLYPDRWRPSSFRAMMRRSALNFIATGLICALRSIRHPRSSAA